MARLYLASGSPRRRDLLEQIGVPFRVISAPVDEQLFAGESPEVYVERLARSKAQAGWAAAVDAQAVVLGADTCVVLDGQVLGKPEDQAQAQAMLKALSGRSHRVLTAVALCDATREQAQIVESEVSFGWISEAQMQAYWDTGEPCDKAGGYAIQGLGAVFVRSFSGSYSAVVGLPLYETSALLAHFGIACWQKGSGQ